jgi:hypothetical protein
LNVANQEKAATERCEVDERAVEKAEPQRRGEVWMTERIVKKADYSLQH